MIHKMNKETTTIYFLEEELEWMQKLLELKAYKEAREEEDEWMKELILESYESDATKLYTQNTYETTTSMLYYDFADILAELKHSLFIMQFKDILKDAVSKSDMLDFIKEERLKEIDEI